MRAIWFHRSSTVLRRKFRPTDNFKVTWRLFNKYWSNFWYQKASKWIFSVWLYLKNGCFSFKKQCLHTFDRGLVYYGEARPSTYKTRMSQISKYELFQKISGNMKKKIVLGASVAVLARRNFQLYWLWAIYWILTITYGLSKTAEKMCRLFITHNPTPPTLLSHTPISLDS